MTYSMENKICVVTGANSGIGKVTARELAASGAEVIAVARSQERGQAAVDEIKQATGKSDVHLMLCDLSSQRSIRDFTEAFKKQYGRLDVLVNNAGVFSSSRYETVDGLEQTFALNHLGYFMTTLLLLDELEAAEAARVVNVSSDAHRGGTIKFDDLQAEKKYSGFQAYSDSKLANVLFTYELVRRLGDSTITTNALHPGFVATNFAKNNGRLASLAMSTIGRIMGRSPDKGAETSVYLATSPDVTGETGLYYTDCKPVQSSVASYDESVAARLWEVSLELTELTDLALASH